MRETVMLGSSRLGLCHTQRYIYIYRCSLGGISLRAASRCLQKPVQQECLWLDGGHMKQHSLFRINGNNW